MENIVLIFIWIAIALAGLALLCVVVFGIRSATYGKLRPVALISVAIPALLFAILYFVFQGEPKPEVFAAIWTTVITMVLAIGALLLAGVRGVIS